MKMKLRIVDHNYRFKLRKLEPDSVYDLRIRDIQTITKPIGEPYEGEYEVEPTFAQQTLPTTNKFLSQDITIDEIRVSKVSNLFGGKTVYIGSA